MILIFGKFIKEQIPAFLDTRIKDTENDDEPRLLDDETIRAIKNQIDGIGDPFEEDFETGCHDSVILEESKSQYMCSRCASVYYSKPKFCKNCGLHLSTRQTA